MAISSNLPITYVPNPSGADGRSAYAGAIQVNGSPEGSVTAPVGIFAIDVDTGTVYVKATGTGSTGWVAMGGGGGGGTVTSVALTMPTGFSVGGSPITTSGTFAVSTALDGIITGNGSEISAISFVDVPRGGTGLTTVPAGEILYGNATGALQSNNALFYSSGTLTVPQLNIATGGGALVTVREGNFFGNIFGVLVQTNTPYDLFFNTTDPGFIEFFVADNPQLALIGSQINAIVPLHHSGLLATDGSTTINSTLVDFFDTALNKDLLLWVPNNNLFSIYGASTSQIQLLPTPTITGFALNASEVSSGVLGPTFGGTGQSSIATGDLLYGSATNTWSKLAGVVTGNALISGGVTTAPSWGKIGLTTHVSGTLAATNGGTGTATVTTGDILYGSATNTWSKLAGVATGNALISGGVTTAPSWGKIGLTTHVSGTLGPTNGGTGTATVTTGDLLYGSATNTWSKLGGAATGNALISGGTTTAPSWGKIGLTTHITGVLPIDNGGTNSISGTTAGSTIQDTGILYRSSTKVVTMNNPGNQYLTFDGLTLSASAAVFGNTTSINILAVHNVASFDVGLAITANQYINIGGGQFLTNGTDFQFGPGGAVNASPYMYTTYINNGSGPHIVSNYNAQGNFDSLYEERFYSGDSSYVTALGYVRYDDASGTLNVVFGSDGGGDKVTINTSTGKISAAGGVDPPYVLYDAHTRAETKERILREITGDKRNGAALFWCIETMRFEIYIASVDEFFDLNGTIL